MLGSGTRANQTYRRNQQVAGASAGGSNRARCRRHTRRVTCHVKPWCGRGGAPALLGGVQFSP
eukprot:scaffold10728_cov64-Phaeocystis_antarctica.AAC.7